LEITARKAAEDFEYGQRRRWIKILQQNSNQCLPRELLRRFILAREGLDSWHRAVSGEDVSAAGLFDAWSEPFITFPVAMHWRHTVEGDIP
jgi:hypothetical protein